MILGGLAVAAVIAAVVIAPAGSRRDGSRRSLVAVKADRQGRPGRARDRRLPRPQLPDLGGRSAGRGQRRQPGRASPPSRRRARRRPTGRAPAPVSGLQVAVCPNAAPVRCGCWAATRSPATTQCGIGGKNCSIGTGAPMTDRLLLGWCDARLWSSPVHVQAPCGTDNVLAVLRPGTARPPAGCPRPFRPATPPCPPSRSISPRVVPASGAVAAARPPGRTDPALEQQPPTVAQMPKAPEANLVAQATSRGSLLRAAAAGPGRLQPHGPGLLPGSDRLFVAAAPQHRHAG